MSLLEIRDSKPFEFSQLFLKYSCVEGSDFTFTLVILPGRVLQATILINLADIKFKGTDTYNYQI